MKNTQSIYFLKIIYFWKENSFLWNILVKKINVTLMFYSLKYEYQTLSDTLNRGFILETDALISVSSYAL